MVNKFLFVFCIEVLAFIFVLSVYVNCSNLFNNVYSQQQPLINNSLSTVNILYHPTTTAQNKSIVVLHFTATVKNITKPEVFGNLIYIGDNISGDVTYKNYNISDITLRIKNIPFGTLPLDSNVRQITMHNSSGIDIGSSDKFIIEALGIFPIDKTDISKIGIYFDDTTGKAFTNQNTTSYITILKVWPIHFLLIDGPPHSHSSMMAQITSTSLLKQSPGTYEKILKIKNALVKNKKTIEKMLEIIFLDAILSATHLSSFIHPPSFHITVGNESFNE